MSLQYQTQRCDRSAGPFQNVFYEVVKTSHRYRAQDIEERKLNITYIMAH